MFIEAEWSRTKTIPTIDAYMQNACETFGFEQIILPALYLLGPKLSDDVATNRELNYILKTTSICGRLLNDIQTFKVYSPFMFCS
jgi:ent-kaurene synthase